MVSLNNTRRSVDAEDYQDLPGQVGAMPKSFADGHRIDPHAHPRDQLLYSLSGIMRMRTETQSLVVPPDRAVFIPAGVEHSVEMHGGVEMRTLYLVPTDSTNGPRDLSVLSVSALLRELIEALCDEPMAYEVGSRGEAIARLILLEIDRSAELPLSLPLPRDPRLHRMCATILADPSDARPLDSWADTEGASARTLARLFQSDLGMTFGKWRGRVRLHHAIETLTEGKPIAEVARSCGYRSPSAFSAAFRKATGMSPSDVFVSGVPPANAT